MCREAMRALYTGEVHVWLARIDDAPAGAAVARWASVLDDGEQARMKPIVFERDARVYAAAHALLRQSLSQYERTPPHAWRFRSGPHGRPEIDTAWVESRLRFNLSHTNGLAACAVALDTDVGVDVERWRALRDPIRMASAFLSTRELAALARDRGDARLDRFFTLWTLKEAYVKARGTGLTVPVHRATIAIDGGRGRIESDAALGDDDAAWQLTHARATREHHLAVVARRDRRDGRDRDVRVRWASAA
jgi:4'-phosphopantetheinyl transferase